MAWIAVRPAEILAKRARRARAHPGSFAHASRSSSGRRPLVADVDRRRRALEHVQLADDLGQLGDRLHGRGAGADDADPLALQVDVVVPARRVERLALERLHALDAGQLRARQDAVGEDHEAGPHGVAAIGVTVHRPVVLVPLGLLDGGVEQAVVVEAELARPSSGSTRGSRTPRRTSSSGRSPSPRAAGGSCTTRRRRRCPGSGSSTTCRRRRRPSRRSGRRRTRPRSACATAAARRTRRRRRGCRTRRSAPRAAPGRPSRRPARYLANSPSIAM